MHRRKHHKSRKGCIPCKSRRIKCDEQGPPCFNCVSRQTECLYAADRVPSQPPSSSTGESPDDPPEVEPFSNQTVASPQPRQFTKFEVQLIIQWTTSTYKSMGEPKDHKEWQYGVASRALTWDFLMEGLFAISAMHIADSGLCAPDERKIYVDAACEYFLQFCRTFQRDLPLVTFENHRVFVGGSIMMMVFGLHPPQYHADNESFLDRIKAVCVLVQGTLSLGLKGIDKNRKEPIRLELLLDRYESHDVDEDISVALQRLRHIIQREANRNYAGAGAATDPNILLPLYEKAMFMFEAWWHRSHLGDTSTAFTCLVTVPRELLEWIRQSDRLALMFLFHWSVMLEELCQDQIWWALSFGRNLLLELYATLVRDADDDLWLEALAWGRARVTNTNTNIKTAHAVINHI